jgi:hypothetical protein
MEISSMLNQFYAKNLTAIMNSAKTQILIDAGITNKILSV